VVVHRVPNLSERSSKKAIVYLFSHIVPDRATIIEEARFMKGL
jgi:hypothetical protein